MSNLITIHTLITIGCNQRIEAQSLWWMLMLTSPMICGLLDQHVFVCTKSSIAFHQIREIYRFQIFASEIGE